MAIGSVIRRNVKVLSALSLAVITGGLLWFAAPTQAVEITLPILPAAGAPGSSYTFTFKVDIASSELLPIQSLNLYIYKSGDRAGYQAVCSNLPLNPGNKNYTYAQTGGGDATVTASAVGGWSYSFGYGYASWQGTGYSFFPPSGYGYGYGIVPVAMLYRVDWTAPVGWPEGNYRIEIEIDANGTRFVKLSNLFSLSVGGGGVGGGGGGEGAVGITFFNEYVQADGTVIIQVEARSTDGRAQLVIPSGTKFLTAQGYNGSSVSMIPMDADVRPAPPADGNIIGMVYQLGPQGATFSQPVKLTFIYDDSQIPPGVDERDLVIGYWDATTRQWVTLDDCVVNPETNRITGLVSHFTPFTVIGYKSVPTPTPSPTPAPTTTATPKPPPSPAKFIVSGLTISSSEIITGEQVNIGVQAMNTGDMSGIYTVSLKIDGILSDIKEVFLAGKSSTKIYFTVSKDVAKNYQVEVNGLTNAFTVKPAPPPPSASFSVSQLSIIPLKLDIGQEAVISVLVTNTGDVSGVYNFDLKINGAIVATKEVSLAVKASQRVNFDIAEDTPGTYSVDINGNIGKFTVETPSSPVNWWLIGGISVAVAAVSVIAIRITLSRRKNSIESPFA